MEEGIYHSIMGAVQCAPYRSRTKKGQTMIKVFCDTCGKSIEKATIYRAAFSVYDHDTHSFNSIGKEIDLCTGCYTKFTKISSPEEKPEEKEPSEPAKAEKEKSKPPDPEEKKIDDGKIWALAHAKKPWTMEQIAEEMGIPKSTVYYHLKKMREERGEA